MNEKFIRDRITELRIQKDVPERKMSVDLGHSASYIHSIVSGRSMPSMTEFFYICDYFGITPMEFFNEKEHTSALQQKIIRYVRRLNDTDTKLIADILERLNSPE